MTISGPARGAYLAWRYVDGHRGIDRAQIYWDDGRVEALEDAEHEELCRSPASKSKGLDAPSPPAGSGRVRPVP